MSVAGAPASLISPIVYENKRRILPMVQKGLKISLTVASMLSLIPAFRLAGNLATRGIALISSGVNGAETWKKDHLVEKIAQCSKIALVILGIIAVTVSLPMLSVASVAADLAYNIFEVGRAIYHQDPEKAFMHVAAIVIDSFALAGLITGSWKLMVVAASLSAAALIILGIGIAAQAYQDKKPFDTIDAICNFLQAGVGIASAVMISRDLYLSSRSNNSYIIKNPYDKDIDIYTEDGKYITTVKPGKSVEFKYDYWIYRLKVKCADPSYPDINIHHVLHVVRPPTIEVEDFNKVPIDSTVYPMLKPPAENQTANPHLEEIEKFSNPKLGDPLPCASQGDGDDIYVHFFYSPPKVFHKDSLEKQIPSLTNFTRITNGNEKCHLENFFQDEDKDLEEIVIYFLTHGEIKHLDSLSEEKILQLYYLANRLLIERLMQLTLKSIADRIKSREWKKNHLLREIKQREEVTPLQDLLNFFSF